MTAYYNEIDDYAAEWLRELIRKGQIADGIVDTRSIVAVEAADLRDFTQCHFFAGIGVWSHALRLAGWRDDRPVWTGSCPCQPFSAAGKGKGFEDERHLWPVFHRLIAECRPPVVFGEQVASKDGLAWLDTVFADLEGSGYAAGAVDCCAAGVGAPHIRQRLWLVGERLGYAYRAGSQQGQQGSEAARHWNTAVAGGGAGGLADAEGGRLGAPGPAAPAGEPRGLADAVPAGRPEGRPIARDGQASGHGGDGRPSPTNGHWGAADWLHCRDGKWRPVEARPQPLADGSAESLGRVRSEVCEEIERAIDAAALENKVSRSSLLRALRESLGAQARSVWEAGRLPGLHEAPFLLALLRQLEAQGWAVEEGRALPCEEEQAWIMRVLRGGETPPSASHRRELEEQLARQSADALHLLPSLLARHAQEAWGHAYETYAEIGFPIGHGSPSRVGRLRAYGNAIVPQVAAEVIGAYMEGIA